MNPKRAGADEDEALENLLDRIRNREEEALSRLYDLTCRRVYGIAMRVLGDRNLAEEAALDGYVKVWRQASRFDHRLGSARVWMDTLARNCALDLLRKEMRKNRIQKAQQLLQSPGKTATPEARLQTSQQSQIVKKIVRNLADEYRLPILAAYFEGMSHSQIAKALAQPLGTIKTRIRTGLRILRREFEKMTGAPP